MNTPHTSGTALNCMPGSAMFAVRIEPLYRTRRWWSSSSLFWTSMSTCCPSPRTHRASSTTERPWRFVPAYSGIDSRTSNPGSARMTRRISSQNPGSSAIFRNIRSSIGFSFFALSRIFALLLIRIPSSRILYPAIRRPVSQFGPYQPPFAWPG